jgi:MFS family permease
MPLPKYINKTVVILSLVSLCNDFSSELLYPILPLYLSSLGAAPIYVGFIEGLAELLSACLKLVSGVLSDTANKRIPFVAMGYGSSLVGKGILGLATGWIGILIARLVDRFGKGVRGAARDAMLADSAVPEDRAKVFGLHRSADTVGAVLGPILALVLINYSFTYKGIIYLSIIPGIIGMLLIYFLKEKKNSEVVNKVGNYFSFKNLSTYWQQASIEYKKFTAILFLFALGNSSDMFLLLKLKGNGYTDAQCIQYYLLFNVSFMLLAYIIGIWADRFNKILFIVIGLIAFALAYYLIASNINSTVTTIAFLIYGLYYACTDGVGKAYISTVCAANKKAGAIGLFNFSQGMAFVIAGIFTGLIWHIGAGTFALQLSAGLAIISALLLLWAYIKTQTIN